MKKALFIIFTIAFIIGLFVIPNLNCDKIAIAVLSINVLWLNYKIN
jgi:hypothetical protein